jgi:hypothetical protein
VNAWHGNCLQIRWAAMPKNEGIRVPPMEDEHGGDPMALSDHELDPFAPSLEEIERRIRELNDQRRRIWRSSAPATGTGEVGRRQLAAIEQELEELYHLKRELLARKARGTRSLLRKPSRPGKPTPPPGLFRDEDSLVE